MTLILSIFFCFWRGKKLDLGKKILYYRKKKQLTQGELSLGICSVPYLSKVENDKIKPSLEILELLSKKLGFVSSYLLQEENNALSEKILLWKEYLDLRNIKKSKIIHHELLKLIRNEDNLDLLNLYELYYMQYILLINDSTIDTYDLNKFNSIKPFLQESYMYDFHKQLGRYYYRKNMLDNALECYLKILNISDKKNSEDYDFYFQLSLVYSRLLNPTKALIYAHKALVGFEKQLNYQRALECNLLLSIIYNDLFSPEEARDILMRMLKNNLPHYLPSDFEAKIYQNLGYSYFLLEDFNHALTYFKKSYTYKKTNAEKLNSLYMSCLSIVRSSSIDYFEFYSSIDEGLRLSVSEKNKNYHYKFIVLKHSYKNKWNDSRFIDFIEKSILPEFTKNNDYHFLITIYEGLQTYYQNNYHYKKALFYFTQLENLKKRSIIQ